MAIYHFSGSVVGRSSNPSASCSAAAAYRSAEQVGEHDYTKKKGVAWSGMLFCDNCPQELQSREALWSAVDSAEKRKDSQLFRSFDFAFPNSFTYKDCQECAVKFASEQWVSLGMCVDLSVHDTMYNGQRNLHGHAMCTLRDIDENGIGKKNRSWNEHELMPKWREAWSAVINERLQELGIDEEIDHRSYKDQGETELQPTVHLGRSVTALERKGVKTMLGDFNRRIKALNDAVRSSLAWKIKDASKGSKRSERQRMNVDEKKRPHTRSRSR